MFHRYPEDLFGIRNVIVCDLLEDCNAKINIEVPEGMKGIPESGIHVVNTINRHFQELSDAVEKKNDKLEERIKRHIFQILSVVLRTCEYNMETKELHDQCKLINICVLTVIAITNKASNFSFEYFYYIT